MPTLTELYGLKLGIVLKEKSIAKRLQMGMFWSGSE